MSIFKAVATNNIEDVIQLLAAPGINVNNADNDGYTSLMMASEGGHTATVQLLLAVSGIDVNLADDEGMTALMYASMYGHTQIVKLLLAVEGIDVNHADEDGDTALILASLHGHIQNVTFLLTAPGIDVNKASNNGNMALMVAAHKNHYVIVKLLTDANEPFLVRKNKRVREWRELPARLQHLFEWKREIVKNENAMLVDLWLAKEGLIHWQSSKYEKIRAKRCRLD